MGAAVGAPLRWWIDRLWQQRGAALFPWGTLTANGLGSVVLGALVAEYATDARAYLLVGIGFCGALTTFSSFAWETYRLTQDGARLLSLLNVLGSVLVCFVGAWMGWAVTNALGNS